MTVDELSKIIEQSELSFQEVAQAVKDGLKEQAKSRFEYVDLEYIERNVEEASFYFSAVQCASLL